MKHSLLEVIFISVVATLCGMSTSQDIAGFTEEERLGFASFYDWIIEYYLIIQLQVVLIL